MSLIIFAAIAFLSIQPAWNIDQNFFYFHRTNHPSILSTDEHASVAHLDVSNPINQRLQVRSAELDQVQPQSESTVSASSVSPETAEVVTEKAPTAQPQPLLEIPPHNRFQQLYGPAQVTSYYHNTLAGPLPLPFQHLQVSNYENVGEPQLPTFGNPPLLFQQTVPTHAALPIVNVQPAPIPQPLFLHPSTISNAQGFFEVRQPSVTGYAYSIGSNDKIVATSSFTLGSSKHDPSFGRFKFLGQRPFENFANPYSSHLFQGKGTNQKSVAPTVTVNTTPEPAVVITKTTQKAKENTPVSAPTIPTATEQTGLEEQKVSETVNGRSFYAPEQKTSKTAEETLPDVEEIASDKNIPKAIESKLPEADEKVVPQVVETKVPSVEGKVVVPEPDVPEADETKVPSVEKEQVPELIAENIASVDKNSVSEADVEKVPEVDDDLISELDEKSVQKVESDQKLDTVEEKPTSAVEQSASDSDKPRLANVSSDPIIPEAEVIVPNTGRVRGIPSVVSDGDETRTSPVEAVQGIVIPETQNAAVDSVEDDKDTKLSTEPPTTTVNPQIDSVTVVTATESTEKSVAEMVLPSAEITSPELAPNSLNQTGGSTDDQEKEGYEVQERSYNAKPPNQNSFQSLFDTETRSEIKSPLVFPKIFSPVFPTVNEISTTVPTTDAPTTQFIPSASTTAESESQRNSTPIYRYGTVQSKYLPTPETRALKLLQAARFRKVDLNKTKPSLLQEKQPVADQADGSATNSNVKPTKRPRVRVVIKTKVRDQKNKNDSPVLLKST